MNVHDTEQMAALLVRPLERDGQRGESRQNLINTFSIREREGAEGLQSPWASPGVKAEQAGLI